MIGALPVSAQTPITQSDINQGNYYSQYAVLKWGSHGTNDGQFFGPGGIAIDSHDNVYVSDEYNNRVSIFNSDGHFITKWELSFQPFEIEIDSHDNVYILSDYVSSPTTGPTLNKFTMDGKLVQVWGNASSNDVHIPIISSGHLLPTDVFPIHVVIDHQDNVHLVYNNQKSLVYSSNGQRLSDFQSSSPLAFDSKGNFYESTIYNFDVKSWIAYDSNGSSYKSEDPMILKLDSKGDQVIKWKINEFPHDLAIDSHDNVYIIDEKYQTTNVFSPEGNILEILNDSLTPQNPFNPIPEDTEVFASSLAIDSHDNVYVVGGPEEDPGVFKFLPLSRCPSNCQQLQIEKSSQTIQSNKLSIPEFPFADIILVVAILTIVLVPKITQIQKL